MRNSSLAKVGISPSVPLGNVSHAQVPRNAQFRDKRLVDRDRGDFGGRGGPFDCLEVEPCDQSHEEAAISNLVNEETTPGDTNGEDTVLPPIEVNQVTPPLSSCSAVMEDDSQGASYLDSPSHSPSLGFKSDAQSFANQTNKKMSSKKKKNRRSRT
ncbi:hypothetical protein U1Q18_017795 [Sarracenia purpurea var. burkii]